MSRLATPEGLLERDRELDRLRLRLGQAAEGRGGLLAVEGPAGIGKSALLAAAGEIARDYGFWVLGARGAELEREFAFGVVRQLLEPPLAKAADADRAKLLQGPAGVAARLLELPGAPRPEDEGARGGTDPSFVVLHGLYWLLVNLATHRPVALAVDDAQWADGGSLRFLTFLLPRLEELRVAVLLGVRPEDVGATELLSTLTLDPVTDVVTLGPLTAAGIARLIATGLGAQPDERFVATCLEVTGGTPFLVHTLVAALVDGGIAPVAASSRRVRELVPAGVGRWALLQVGRLGTDALRLARAVAVLERSDLPEAAALAGLDSGAATSALTALVRAGILDERPLAFSHTVLRTGVYREMPVTDRAEAHRRAARLLGEGHMGAARLAEHLLASDPAADPWVVERLWRAAAVAVGSGAPESAAAYLRRALAEPPAPDALASVALDLGKAEFGANQPGWEGHLATAVEAAADDSTRVRAAVALTTILGSHDRLADALDVCDRVLGRLDRRDSDERWELESMAVLLGTIDATSARRLAERARALVVHAKSTRVSHQVAAIAALQAAVANEPAGDAAELALRAVASGPGRLPEGVDGPWFATALTTLLMTDRFNEAQELLDAALTEARAGVNGPMGASLTRYRAQLALLRGDLIAAEADTRALLDDAPVPVSPLWSVLTTATLVHVLVERGELDAAERALEPQVGALLWTRREASLLHHARGVLRSAQRRYAEALSDLMVAGDLALRTGTRSPAYVAWRSDAALAHLALGQVEAAQQLSAEELELARSFGAPRALGVALSAAGLAAGSQGEPLLREAIEVLDGPDTRLVQARALADLGALLSRSGPAVEAREPLRRALDIAHRFGAAALAARADTELRATGAKPRRVVLSGLDALTSSEYRIAELAARGLTNREIAQRLFVTIATVESHLTRVFTKLDVRSRTDLPPALTAARRGIC